MAKIDLSVRGVGGGRDGEGHGLQAKASQADFRGACAAPRFAKPATIFSKSHAPVSASVSVSVPASAGTAHFR